MLTAVANALPDPMFIIDIEGKYIDIIGGVERSLYDSCRFLIGKRLHDVLPKRTADSFLNIIQKAVQTKQLQTVEYQLSSADCDGSRLDGPDGVQWFEGRVASVQQDDTTKPAVVWVAVNITARKRAEEKLQRLSETDELTGAYNRRFFMNVFKHEFNRFKRHHSPVSIAMMDIDHFKRVNDTYGHPCGDEALVDFVRLMKSKIRKTDVFARIGGEEFALMLVGTHLAGAEPMIERFTVDMKHMKILCGEYEFSITVSIGLTEILKDDETIYRVLSRADNALYEAKRQGRDRIRIA